MAVSVLCPNCQAKLSLKSESALGKKVACPKCKKPFKAAAPPTEDDDGLGFLDEMSAEDDSPPDDEEDEAPEREEEERPSKKAGKKGRPVRRRSGNPLPLILGGVGVLAVIALFVAIGFFVWPLLNRPRSGLDLAWLPEDAEVVVHFRVGEVWGSPFVRNVAGPQLATASTEFQKNAGLLPEDIRSVTAGLADASRLSQFATPAMTPEQLARLGKEIRGSIVIRSAKPLDVEKILKPMTLTETVQHAGKSYRKTNLKDGTLTGFLPQPDMLVLADETTMKVLLDKNGTAARRPEFDFVDLSHHLIIVAAPKNRSMNAGMPDGAAGLSPEVQQKVRAQFVGVTATENIDMAAKWDCEDGTTSQAIKTFLDTKINEGKQQFAQLKSSPLAAMFGPIAEVVDPIMNSIQTQSNGSMATLTARVPGSIKASIDKLMAQSGQGGMGFPFGGLGGAPPTQADMPASQEATNAESPGSLPGFPTGDPAGTPTPVANPADAPAPGLTPTPGLTPAPGLAPAGTP